MDEMLEHRILEYPTTSSTPWYRWQTRPTVYTQVCTHVLIHTTIPTLCVNTSIHMGISISLGIYFNSESIEIGARRIGDVLLDTDMLVYTPYTPSISTTRISHILIVHIYVSYHRLQVVLTLYARRL